MKTGIHILLVALMLAGCSPDARKPETRLIYPNQIIHEGGSSFKELGKYFDQDSTTTQVLRLKDSLQLFFDPIEINNLALTFNNGDQSTQSAFYYLASVKTMRMVINDQIVREIELKHKRYPQSVSFADLGTLKLEKIVFHFEDFQFDLNEPRSKFNASVSEIKIQVLTSDVESNAYLPLKYVPKLHGKVSNTETKSLDTWSTKGENAKPFDELQQYQPMNLLLNDPEDLLICFPGTPLTETLAEEWGALLEEMEEVSTASTCVETKKDPFENGLRGGKIWYTQLAECPASISIEERMELLEDTIVSIGEKGNTFSQPFLLQMKGKQALLYGEKVVRSDDGELQRFFCLLNDRGLIQHKFILRSALKPQKEGLQTMELYTYEYQGNWMVKGYQYTLEFGYLAENDSYFLTRSLSIRVTQ